MRTMMGSAELAQVAAEVAASHTPGSGVAEHGGVEFQVLGEGISRVALLGPDGVVYKTSKPGRDQGQFASEVLIFDALTDQGVTWCPSYWPYEEHRVMAMPRYRVVHDLNTLTPDQWGLYWAEMQTVWFVPVGVGNFGVRTDGSLVLIDAGRADARARD